MDWVFMDDYLSKGSKKNKKKQMVTKKSPYICICLSVTVFMILG